MGIMQNGNCTMGNNTGTFHPTLIPFTHSHFRKAPLYPLIQVLPHPGFDELTITHMLITQLEKGYTNFILPLHI